MNGTTANSSASTRSDAPAPRDGSSKCALPRAAADGIVLRRRDEFQVVEKIMQRVGHEDWDTMKKYLRTAEKRLAVAFGEVFPGLFTLEGGSLN